MKYVVKILTKDCLDKIDKMLNEMTDDVDEQIRLRHLLYSHWQYPEGFLLVEKLLSRFGLAEPEYVERTYMNENQKIYDVGVYINWNGTITAISDIDDIYAFKQLRE